MSGPAVVVLTPSALGTARRVAEALPGARLHGLRGLRGRVGETDESFDEVGEHLRALFRAGTPIVGVCAAGVVIRCLAPVLADKRAEPPVLAVAEDGTAVVPLLGGHHGANDLARTLAQALGGSAAVTTAGDLRFGVALDAPPAGWRLANPDDVKGFAAELLAGATVRLSGEAPWLRDSELPWGEDGSLVIRVSERAGEGDARTLVYHPRCLAVGVGCERGTDPGEVRDLVEATLAEGGLAQAAVAVVVSLDLKCDEPALHDVAGMLDVPARFFDAETLEREAPRLANPSDAVFREVGCHGVAEGAALAAAGAEGELIVPKRKSRRATCAIARAPAPLQAGALGVARGSLAVVGIGPGQAAWRTADAESLVADATDLVGYGLYLDLLGPPGEGQTRHAFDLGEEEDRARAALDLAAAGRRVVLISSGDAGIYAMAAPVFELLERENRPAWKRVRLSVSPGVSALQAAAARAGAPLGHDFCAISLSDLLTPWEVIERRLRAAAEGDFVVALFNPVSRRRTTQLARARDILGEHRPPATPVVLARNLGRESESVEVTTLAELEPERVDMLTLVLVGSTETRVLAGGAGRPWVYTPRGYGSKAK